MKQNATGNFYLTMQGKTRQGDTLSRMLGDKAKIDLRYHLKTILISCKGGFVFEMEEELEE